MRAALRHRSAASSVALATLCTLLFLTFLDNTVVSVALGDIQTTLHAGISDLQWVVSAYALTFASLMLACGMIGDELGRKKVMLGGAAVFCGGSVLCALAPSPGVLIAGRAIMGMGAAASEPGTLSMLRHIYDDEPSRNRAVGVWAAVSGLALALGPVVGGVLVGAWNWRAIFWFNLALGLFALAAASLLLPENADPAAHRVDTTGTLLGAAGLAALVFAVINGEQVGFGNPTVIVLFAVAALAAAAFVWWERRAAHPLLDLRYLRRPGFSTSNVAALCTYFATFAIFFFTALYLGEVVGTSAFRVALTFLPMTILMIGCSVLSGRLTSIVGARVLVTVGCVVFAAGLLLTAATISPTVPYLPLAASLAVTGIGIGTSVTPITATALSAVPPERSGMAASATNTSREIGAVTGVAVLGALVNAQLRAHLTSSLHHLHVPVSFDAIIINALETGAVPSGGHTRGAGGSLAAGHGQLVNEVVKAAYAAFESGLHAALYLSAGLVLLAGLLALVTLGRPRPEPPVRGEASRAGAETA